MNLRFVKLNRDKSPMTNREETYNSIDNLDSAGLLLNNQVVVVDFDNDNITENKIVEHLKSTYPTQVVETDRGFHFYYSMPEGVEILNWSDKVTIGGFQVDYKTGNSYMVVKLNGRVRKCNQELTLDGLPPLPIILYPLKRGKNISGLSEGDGRNNELFKHLMLLREQYNEINIFDISNFINSIVFSEELPERELHNIIKSVATREITFNKDNNDMADFAIFLTKKLDIKRYSGLTYIKYGLAYSSSEELLQRESNKYKKLKLNQFTELKHQLITYSELVDDETIFKIKIRNGYIDDNKIVSCNDEFTPFFLDVEYVESAYDEEVDKFLNFICCDRKDMRMVLEEIIGHILMITKQPAHLFFFTGNGQNGKSTFAGMLSSFAGKTASFIDISKFNDGTCILECKDKLINVAEDIDNTSIEKAKYLKTFASGETISARAIYKNPVKMRNTATMIFTTNDVPSFCDKTNGIRRRVLIIPFDAEVTTRNPRMVDLLSTQKAKSYILKLGLQGISRIIQNGYKLSESKTIIDATNLYHKENDSIVSFLEESPDIHNIPTQEVYEAYKSFCNELGIDYFKKPTFSKYLCSHGYLVKNTTLMRQKIRIYVRKV